MEIVRVYSGLVSHQWLAQFRGQSPQFACVLGFTATGLIPHISAAGATPADRQHTALADAEFLYRGCQRHPTYPLPPLTAGASPALISRAIVAQLHLPLWIFNAGCQPPTVPYIDLEGTPARCVSSGRAMDRATVQHLLQRGLEWGEKLAAKGGYLVLGECVVGGTTTALAVLLGLGWDAAGKVNSSHVTCNHDQKRSIAWQGLQHLSSRDPIDVVAAVGDPMQIAVAGMAIAASRQGGVLLAGGTQMLAVYALIDAIVRHYDLGWQPDRVVVGTTRWVAEDPTGDTAGLASLIGAPLIATQFSFAASRYARLRAYEQGYVKEGVGAGGCAIAAHLYRGWHQTELLEAIEALAAEQDRLANVRSDSL